MKIAKVLFSILFFVVIVAVCLKNHSESTQTLVVSTLPISGSNMLLSITSTKYNFDVQESEVRQRLETTINGGEYNITSVKTSYSSGYLTAAEVLYDASGRGDGNNMRVVFIHSDMYNFDMKAADIKPRLEEVVNSGKYDIVKIDTTYEGGYLLAAEVYYREKQ